MKTFLKAWGLNLLVSSWILLAAVVLLVLHFVLDGFSLWFIAIPIALWLIYSLVSTGILYAGNRNGNDKDPGRPNVNPYSKKTEDFKTKK